MTCLISGPLTVCVARSGARELDLLFAILRQELNHRHDLADGSGQVGRLADRVAPAREIEQPVR